MDAILAGELAPAASLMRDLEDGIAGANAELKALLAAVQKQPLGPHLVGITGAPGSGKSTLVDGLISVYRSQGVRVGVVAVDPASPFSGGALLGDRIRMQRHASDDGVFIRSLSNRGHLGGLSLRTAEVAAVLGAMGFPVVLIETVGVGQSELEVTDVTETVVVVMVPGLGDEVQALKSGLLEVADLLVLNKCDLAGADQAEQNLRTMLSLRGSEAPEVPLLRTVASTGDGISALPAALAAVRAQARKDEARHHMRTQKRLRALVMGRFQAEVDERLSGWLGRAIDELSRRVTKGELDLFEAVELAWSERRHGSS